MVQHYIHTTSRGHYLVQKLHAGSFPDLLHYCPQLFVGLLQVTCADAQYTMHTKQSISLLIKIHISVLLHISLPHRLPLWQQQVCQCLPGVFGRGSNVAMSIELCTSWFDHHHSYIIYLYCNILCPRARPLNIYCFNDWDIYLTCVNMMTCLLFRAQCRVPVTFRLDPECCSDQSE